MKHYVTQSTIGKLDWFWSDRYWYVGLIRHGQKKFKATGFGKTRDKAFLDLGKNSASGRQR